MLNLELRTSCIPNHLLLYRHQYSIWSRQLPPLQLSIVEIVSPNVKAVSDCPSDWANSPRLCISLGHFCKVNDVCIFPIHVCTWLPITKNAKGVLASDLTYDVHVRPPLVISLRWHSVASIELPANEISHGGWRLTTKVSNM